MTAVDRRSIAWLHDSSVARARARSSDDDLWLVLVRTGSIELKRAADSTFGLLLPPREGSFPLVACRVPTNQLLVHSATDRPKRVTRIVASNAETQRRTSTSRSSENQIDDPVATSHHSEPMHA
jgi:hypothetical protein